MRPRKTADQGAVAAADLVLELVHQFSEPLAFYRELIQNSIDAGANRIDVSLEYDERAAEAVMRVEDDGDGMNEDIIDNYLTVKFRSTKEDDLTKIGKFGIGFVSVFAPKPRLVRLSTARDGESWRVDFHGVKRFDKFKMPRLRDGSLVEVFKPLSREEYAQLVADSRATVRYWCRHADTRITFCDKSAGAGVEPINEAFDLEGGAALRHQEEGTEIVLGPAWTPKPAYGFYNRGLTLKEGEELYFPAVRFKVKSRWLEHTLTRDNVVRDENYKKAMRVVQRLVEDELPDKVLAECEALAAQLSAAVAAGDAAGCERFSDHWGRRLPYLIALFGRRWTFFKSWDERPILPAVGGKAVSVRDAKAALRQGHVAFVDTLRTPVSDALDARERPVLYAGAWAEELARGLLEAAHVATASASFLLPRLIEEARLESGLAGLLARASAVDAGSTYRYARIVAGEFGYPGSCIADEVFVVQNEAGALSSVGERPVSSFLSLGRKRRSAVVNAAHPFVRRLAALHSGRPGLAAFLLLKTLHLHDGDVPAAEREKVTALAERTELDLLRAALKLDAFKGGA